MFFVVMSLSTAKKYEVIKTHSYTFLPIAQAVTSKHSTQELYFNSHFSLDAIHFHQADLGLMYVFSYWRVSLPKKRGGGPTLEEYVC